VTTQEQRWKIAERSLDVQAARRIRRTPGVTIGILAGLVLAVGVTAAVDLRRLQTPRGAALAWSEAATFGDCRGFLSLSQVEDPLVERRTDEEICRALRAATAQARIDSTRITVLVTSVDQEGPGATVRVEVRGPSGLRTTDLRLVRRGNDWLVLRQAGACGEVTCF
jgi:hypothetical protein